ncbi:hypothetical protein GE061_019989 [Apolygus lucorum]|uniref:Protein translocase subunit SecA n=1 Tax=Apolygus lucorum TaxID=248454 RepID=A0A8S9XDZ5_APOLU|nr:hypothetical protein GE061_019989 [Apolygus lucorum]
MEKKKLELSSANIEIVVNDINDHRCEPEDWLANTVLKLNTQFNDLRYDLSQCKNAWSSFYYNRLLVYHYNAVRFTFYNLFQKYGVDSQSVVQWSDKCRVILNEFPQHQMTEDLLELSKSMESVLHEVQRDRSRLSAERDALKNSSEEADLKKAVGYNIALGDVTADAFTKYFIRCEKAEKKRVERTIWNISLLRVISFLEDCISDPHINPISAANHSRSLGKAYFAAGIQDLGNKYTSLEYLMKPCLSFKDNNTDEKSKLKSLILRQVKDKRNLQEVKNEIVEFYKRPLTSIDLAYVETNYSKFCSREFVDESEAFFIKLKESKKSEIMALLPMLKSCDSLLRIPPPLNELDYFPLLKSNYKLLKPEDANESLKSLKNKYFEVVLEFYEMARNELTFIEAFIDFMDSFKDTQDLELALNLRHFCSTESTFGDFIQRVMNLKVSVFGDRLVDVQQAAEPLQNENDMFYVQKFKECVLLYLEPPKIQGTHIDGRFVLEVEGKKIVLSEILRQEQFDKILSCERPHCEEVRFVASNAIHLDVDFDRSKWHGKNILVMTKTIFVHGKISWDVSGNDGKELFSSEAGTGESGVGNEGKDGEAGESGGNVLILSDSIVNSNDLTIISDGGAGGKGQAGGDGQDGRDGETIDQKNFCSKFPPTAKFWRSSRVDPILTTLESISNLHSSIKLKWYERPAEGGSVCMEKNLDNIIEALKKDSFDGNIFIEAVTDSGNEITFSFRRGTFGSFCQSFLLFKGSNGQQGFKGGEGGLGGEGGFPGEIKIRLTRDYCPPNEFPLCIKRPGAEGAPGLGGKYGKHGKNSYDLGYLDYYVTNFFSSTWPKNYGFNGGSKIRLNYEAKTDNKWVWCPYKEYKKLPACAGFEESFNQPTELKEYQERATKKNNISRDPKSKATRKKTISHSQVSERYQRLIEKASLRNLHDEFDDATAQAILAIEENGKMQNKVVIKTQMMRCATLRQRNRTKDPETVVSADMQKKVEKVDDLIDEILKNPQHVDTLSRVCVIKPYLDELYKVLPNLKHEGNSTVEGLLLEKYRFVCLNGISLDLESRETPVDCLVRDIDLFDGIRYLKKSNIETDEISHPILGRLNQYIFRNDQEQRKKLSDFCKVGIFSISQSSVLKLFKRFIFDEGHLEKSSDSTKWFEKYKYFTDKENLGFPIFPESLEKLDREFFAHLSSRKSDVFSDFIRNIDCKGSESISCLELLAYVFDVNIRVYGSSENQLFSYVLKENLNPDCQSIIPRLSYLYLLIDNDRNLTLLEVDVDFWKLEKQRETNGVLFSKIIDATEKFLKKEEFDSFLDKKTYLSNEKFIVDEGLKLLRPIADLKTTIDEILQHFVDIDDRFLLKPKLYKLSPDYLGRSDILENILKRFRLEGNHVSAQELLRLVNSVLQSAAERKNNLNTYRWLVAAYPQDQWISELLLMDIETLFKRSLPEKTKWRQYLRKIENKAVLIVVRDKLRAADAEKPLSVETIDEIFCLLSKIPTEKLQMGDLDLAEWPYALKEKYWKYQLSSLTSREEEEETFVYFTLAIENVFGSQIIEKFIQLLIDKKFKISPDVLSNFKDERWNLSDVELKILSECSTIEEWTKKILVHNNAQMKVRDTNSLEESGKVNAINLSSALSTVKVTIPKSIRDLRKRFLGFKNSKPNTSSNVETKLSEAQDFLRDTNSLEKSGKVNAINSSSALSTVKVTIPKSIGDLRKRFLGFKNSKPNTSSNVETKLPKVQDFIRDTNSLVNLIKGNANTSSNVKALVLKVQSIFDKVREPKFCSSFCKDDGIERKSVREYSENDITSWVQSFKNRIESYSEENDKTGFLDEMNGEALAVITRGIELKRGFRLHDTQMLTVMILLQNIRSTLAQVATGEGKSLIVVAASIIKALKGDKVDIITSSSVLARRDATDNADIYSLFQIHVSHNCNDDVEVRKQSYSNNQVVYGDLSDFQRDYLLHEFYDINVLGDRNFVSVIVDEVDSMLLDKGNNMLYLSHGIPELDKLESVYLYIWRWINRPCWDRNGVLTTFDANAIKASVMYDLFGMIGKKDIKALDVVMTNVQAASIWERLFQHKIIDRKSRPTIDRIDRGQIEKALSPDLIKYTDRLHYLFMERLSRDRKIQVPNCLKPFVELHLDQWIANAIRAYFMKAGEDYVVDVDRTGTSADRNPNIIIIDKDTGTDQTNSQWVEALHQFLQLKHNCKLSVQSLKAVFISNVAYFKLYRNLYGLTGTLGSKAERKLLEDVYEADFVTIPTAKPKQFIEHSPILCSGEAEWCRRILEESKRFVQKSNRSVLIVCESVNDVELLSRSLGEEKTFTIHTYTREYEEFDVTQSRKELEASHIIIATNLAGRGTDIKINSDLKSAGGLHVILSYLPSNARIEQQAFGRAARCGDEGSGQLIIKSHGVEGTIIRLKIQRDREELERISKIKLFYKNQICSEEKCFSQFKQQYKTLRDQLIETPKEVQTILLQSCIDRWAFWLDRNSELINDLSSSESREAIDKSLKKFISHLHHKSESEDDWIAWVDDYPVPMVKLAKFFLRKQKFDKAVELFDLVIQAEPNFCVAAHYYKAGALGNMINWKSTSEDRDNKSKFENELIQAAKLFDKLGNEAVMNSAILSQFKYSNKQSIIQIDAYEEQNKNLANLYRFFSKSIGDILGHAVMPESFVNYSVKEPLASKLMNEFFNDGTLNHSLVSKQNMTQSEKEDLSSSYGISLSDLDAFLDKWDNKKIESFREFKADMKHNLCLPSKKKFWKELIRLDFLSDEVKYVIVDDEKLSELDPSLLDCLKEKSEAEPKHVLEQEDGYLFLNSELLPYQKNLGKVFLKEKFMDLLGKKSYLDLKNREVLHFNNKCQLRVDEIIADQAAADAPKYFSSCDSISVQDFVRNRVSENEAEIVLQELVDKQIVERRSDSNYRLATNFSQIDNINLNIPVYKPITKSLLYICFAYRIALQKIASQIHDGVAVSIPLNMHLYRSLIWDLYECKVISPSKVSKGKHCKDSMQNSLTSTFERSKLASLLNNKCIPQEDPEALIEQLISKKWLVNKMSTPSSPKLEINKEEGEWEPLDQCYRKCEKTAKKILTDLLKLSSETTLTHIVSCLGRLKSDLENFDDPSFNLKALTETSPDDNFFNAQEKDRFISNGLGEILILGKKRLSFLLILNSTLTTFIGCCQIAIGAIIGCISVGSVLGLCTEFISAGISDIMYAIRAVVSRYFSWKDYLAQKAVSVVTAGIRAFWYQGGNESRVGSKLGLNRDWVSSQTVGAQVLPTADKSVGKEMIKRISLKTFKEVGLVIANMAVDEIFDNFLQDSCDLIASEIMNNVERVFKSHEIASVLRKAFEVMGENDARDMMSNLTQTFGTQGMWKEFESIARRIFSSFEKGVSEATSKVVQSGQSTGNISWVVRNLCLASVCADKVEHLLKVCGITSRLLDKLSKEMNKIIADKTPVEAHIESNYDNFERKVVVDLKKQFAEQCGQIINRQAHSLLKALLIGFGEKEINNSFLSYKGSGLTEVFDMYKRQFEESVEIAGDDVQAVQPITKEYHGNLLSLLSKTRNPQLLSDIIMENVPMDMTCLQVFAKMLPIILQRLGIRERVSINVEEGDNVTQVFAPGSGEAVERVIRLRANKPFKVVRNNGNHQAGMNPGSINCLYFALSEHFDLGLKEDKFRYETARMIREDEGMKNKIEKWRHEYVIASKMYRGAHPYDHEDEDWSFNSKVDVDLCRGKWVDTDYGKEWEEENLSLEELHRQRTEAYRKALQRINEIVTGNSRNSKWTTCKLLHPHGRIQPSDFEATIYDTIRVHEGLVSIGYALYPVEFKTEITVKKWEFEYRYKVEINTNVVYCGQRGPQGPHIGFSITREDEQGLESLTGHCLINSAGNEHLPHRAKEKVRGIYHVSDDLPQYAMRIPVRKLFHGPNRTTTHLERLVIKLHATDPTHPSAHCGSTRRLAK